MIYLFDKHKKLKGTVRARHTIALLYERERNGIYSVSAEIPVSLTDKRTVYNYHKKVKGSDFIGHYDREGRFQLHKIAAVDIENTSIFIKGIHLFFDEAKAGAIIRERRFRGREIIDGAREAFDPIGWSVVDFDTSDQKNYSFYNVSPLEARAILVETFGFEFDYWLDFDGKNIRNKQIAVKRKIGKETNKRYNYGHNVLSIKVEQDYSEIYTAVIGRGKGEDLDDSDGYGRRIEFTDIEWKKPSKPLDKAKGSRTLIDPNATQLFGYHDGNTVSPRTKVEIFSDIEDEAQLLQASYDWLMDNNVPKAVFSLNVPDGDGLDLGDSVHVIYRDIDLIKSTRVTKVIDDLVSGNRSVEFGDTAYFDTDRRISGLKSELKRVGGSSSNRITRLKEEFDRRFDAEVQQWKDDFEQAVIDAEAAVEVMRVTMTEEFEAAQKEFEDEFNKAVADAMKHADETAEEKAKEVQDNLDSFAGHHEQLVGELQGNIIDIDGDLEDARADVSEIVGRLTGLDGRVSTTEASLTVMDDEISSVVGRVSDNETVISSVVQDVGSITSTVATLEGDVSTQGSQITQTKDVIDSKVWLDDVANINPNLIPFTDVSAPESKPHWNNWGTGVTTNTFADNLGYMNVRTDDSSGTIRIQSEEIDLVEGQEYTLSFLARTSSSWNTDGMFAYTFVLWPGFPSNQILGSANHTIEYLGSRLSGLRRYTHTFTSRHTGKAKIMLGTYKFRSGEEARFSFKEPKLEKGSERTPFLNAFSNIEQTANSIRLSVLGELEGGYVSKSEFDVTVEGIESRVAKIDGGGVLKQSDISVTSGSVIIGSREISSNNLASIIAVSPSAVNVITNKLNLTGNANVKGQIESISMSAVKADFADLFAARVKAGAVEANYVEGFAARFSSLYTLNANIEKLVVQNVFTRKVRSLSIEAVEANIGSIRSKILTSNVIKSSHVNTSTALIDKIFASTAMFERMMAKSGFVRTLNTVTIDTDQITIRRPDGARLVNNGMLKASFDVQIRPNHASSEVKFTGINYATQSAIWRTFEHFYTDHKGSKLLISWAVDFYGPSASEYVEVRVRGFGGNNPIGTSNKRIFSNGSTAYLNHTVSLGVPDYKTIQAYLEFRRSPNGSSAQNTVRVRVLRVSIVD